MPELNPMQRKVVLHTPGDGALLVTAAAGSGKTAVVVERVVSLITREENPIDISRLLIITFTKAAAEEMRSRITLAVRKAMEASPGNRNLARQYKLLHTAEISTIDSFYLRIVRASFHVLGISPDARIADEEEAAAIRKDVIETLLEEKYAAKDPAFLTLSDMLSHGSRDSVLGELLWKIHNTFQSMPRPAERLRKAKEAFDFSEGDIARTLWGAALLKDAERQISAYKKRFEALCVEFLEDEKLKKVYLPIFTEDIGNSEALLNAIGDWDRFSSAINALGFSTLRSPGKDADPELQKRAKAVRDKYKKTIEKLKKNFTENSETVRKELKRLAPAASALAALAEEFSVRYRAEKNKNRILEFDDVSQYVYELLWYQTPDGSMALTSEAGRIARRYDEVIVDEYQDTNRLQDEIFHAITCGGRNLLMVGDIKQSIYGFRNAEPEAFVEKLMAYRPADGAKSGEPRKQSLNLNYRSSGSVIDYTNFVFSHLMKKEVGGIAYDDDQKLFMGRKEDAAFPTEVIYLSSGGVKKDARRLEAEAIAAKISSVIASGAEISDGKGGMRKVHYGDFAILMRTTTGRYAIYEKALKEAGIPVSPPHAPELYSLPEGEFVLALLSTVDNPLNDIMLLSVLASAVFKFTPDELANIRLEARKAPFIEAMRLHAEKGDEKCAHFLALLSSWRRERSEMKLGMLVRKIYDDISLASLLMADGEGEERVENIYLIASLAEKYESRGGLSAYLRGTARALESEKPPEGASHASKEAAVAIMTIHHSKGLQFPFVILADTAGDFNTKGFSDAVIFHKEIGFGFRIHDTEKGIRYSTVTHGACRLFMERTQCEEEMRILYVALTRAMEKLIIYVTVKDAEKYLSDTAAVLDEESIAPLYHSYGEWLTAAALLSEEGEELRMAAGMGGMASAEKSGAIYSIVPASGEEEQRAEQKEKKLPQPDPILLSEELDLPYPYAYAGSLPTKRTATEVKETVRNPELFDEGEKESRIRKAGRPAFLEERGLSASERGTAIHLALRLTDPQKAATYEGVRGEIERLVAGRWLTAEEASAVNAGKLLAFFSSPLGKRLAASKDVRRELKFTLLEDAGKSFPEMEGKGERILLQGIIDCAFLEGDGWVLIDYKSDWLERDEDAARHALAHGYDRQLGVYREALERMTGLPVREGYIYFTSRSAEVRLF